VAVVARAQAHTAQDGSAASPAAGIDSNDPAADNDSGGFATTRYAEREAQAKAKVGEGRTMPHAG
jgi:hypothetical protein